MGLLKLLCRWVGFGKEMKDNKPILQEISRIVVPEQLVGLSVAEETGLVTINTSKRSDGNKTFSEIVITKQMSSDGSIRHHLSATYQFVYSAAQILELVEKNTSKDRTPVEVLQRIGVSAEDYVVRYDFGKLDAASKEKIRLKKSKIILSKKFKVDIDCPEYVIIY